MRDRGAMPDAVEVLADSVRATALPSTAVLSTRRVVGALSSLPSGKSIYMLLTDTPAGSDLGDGYRAEVSLQLDVWAPSHAQARAAWEQVRRHFCARGGHPADGGSISRVSCTMYPIGAPSEAPALTHITSLFTATVSTRGRA